MMNPEDLDRIDARVFNLGFTLRGEELGDWRLVKATSWEARGDTTYLLQEGEALARIVVSESADADQARERLVEETAHWMHPSPRKDGAESLGVGEVAVWCPDAKEQPATIAFVRGNTVVGVYRADDIAFDAVQLAIRIDRLLVEPEPAAASERQSMPGSERVVIATWTERQGSRMWVEAAGGSVALEAGSVLFVPDSSDDHLVRVWFKG